MLNKFFVILATTLICSFSVSAASKQNIEEFRKDVLGAKKSVISKGTIKSKSICFGSSNVEVDNVTADEFTSQGVAVLNNFSIAKKATFSKSAIVKNSVFKGQVIISAPFVSFEKSTVEKIICDQKNSTEQVIELNDTIVTGNIEFANGNGSVVLNGISKINGGIIGGKIVE